MKKTFRTISTRWKITARNFPPGGNLKPIACIFAAVFLANPGNVAASAPVGDDGAMAVAYLRSIFVQQATEQGQTLVSTAPTNCQPDIKQAMQDWSSKIQTSIREDLQKRFGDSARAKFERFINIYTGSENRNDSVLLAKLASDLGIAPPPTNYAALRRSATETWLKPDLQSGSKLFGDIQTWLDLRHRNTANLPPLPAWLHRDEHATQQRVFKPARPLTLADAEAAPPPQTDGADQAAAAGSLDAFSSMRKARRDQAHQQAQAGMQQIAAEREAWEQENAGKKTAEAQADAENIKKEAEKIAQADKDAIDQYKDSWEMKLKTIASATVSSTVGAFTGTVGSEAAQKAADAIFSTGDNK